MSDILEYQLPKNQLIAINSIQLYLKVNVLSELTDHTGTTLLPEKLTPRPNKDGHIYSSPNCSTLDWPMQLKPGPTAWKKWKEIILWMYAKPAEMTLTDSLGPWLPTYNQDYEWAWQFHEPTQHLYHHHRHVWYEYNNPRQRLNAITYQHECQPRANLPPDTKPVTPKITNKKITLTTPIPNLPNREQLQPPPIRTLYQRMTEPPSSWHKPLWDQVRRHEPIATLRGAIQEGRKIIIVSDATVNHKGQGACAWAIWSQQLLWSGKGRIPADPLDMYSGLAEVYGVYQSLQVLIRYINQYPLIPHQNARAAVYCDNLGVIERITNKPTDQQPRDMLCNDYPIFQ